MSTTPGIGDNVNKRAHSVGLPPRPFLYTLDQISTLLEVSPLQVGQYYIYFEGRSTGRASADLMKARNIAPRNHPPEWRVAEAELVRWMKRKGFKFYDRSSVRN
jgi:hypothetical protein